MALMSSGSGHAEPRARQRASEGKAAACFRGDARHTGVYSTTGPRQEVAICWRLRTDGLMRSSPLLVGSVLYVGSGDGLLRAVDARSGEERWRFKTGGQVASSPAFAEGVVYFTSGDRCLYAVAADSGALRWRFTMGADLPYRWGWDYFRSSPVVAGERVYAGGGDGCIYALTADTGRQVWKFQTGGRVRSSPAYADGTVFVGSMDGCVYALDARGGEQVWKFATEGTKLDGDKLGFDPTSVISSPAIADSMVLFGARDGFLYGLDMKTGTQRWRFSHKRSWVISSPAIAGSLVLAGSSDGRFFQGFDHSTGAEKWRFATRSNVFSSGTVADNEVYFGDQSGLIYALDWATGKLLWRHRLPGPVNSTMAVGDGRIYVGCDDGCLYALEEGVQPVQARGSAKKAVFWDPQRKWKSFRADKLVKDYLADKGYEVLGPASLRAFLVDRTKDKVPSVVVFATDLLPDQFGEDAEMAVLRNYLVEGGKVVWLGAPPLVLDLDRVTGQPKGLTPKRTERLLGIRHADVHADISGTKITADGYRWGLLGWARSSWGVDPRDVDVVLATDDAGRAAAWVRTFNKKITGAGFVHLWGFPDPFPNLREIQSVAEYGLS
jgi:outer membrane protein assembly factor BamB